jgi:hypothetical protein
VQIAVARTAFVARKATTALRSSRTSSRGAEGDRRESAAVGGSFVIEFAELVKKSVHVVHEAGWDRVGLDETLGGISSPKALI